MSRSVLLLAMLLLAGCGQDKSSSNESMLAGNAAYRKSDFPAAADAYSESAERAAKAPEPLYDLALSWYRQGWFADSLRYLDRAEPLARGSLLARCVLLRADIEFRTAVGAKSIQRTGGLERALKLYRDVIAATTEISLIATAKYNIEVVKLRLEQARGEGPEAQSKASSLSLMKAPRAILGQLLNIKASRSPTLATGSPTFLATPGENSPSHPAMP
jgi:tetratricopeptide (TPR) repeat protein